MPDTFFDIESYPNVCLVTFLLGNQFVTYEISDRINHYDYLSEMIRFLQHRQYRMVGFNNLGYDYPVLHYIVDHNPTPYQIFQKSTEIIKSPDKFAHVIWDRDQYVPQVDLFKVHHFDNVAKFTSLKILEFNMRSERIIELPFPVGSYLTPEQIEVLIAYNHYDVIQTKKFYDESQDALTFRETLSETLGTNCINFSDAKIGEQYIIQELEKVNPGCCYTKVPGQGRKTNVTLRSEIRIKDIILPHIIFKNPEFARIKTWFESQVVQETKGVFTDLHCDVHGFRFDFGTGGIHGSVESQTVRTDEQGAIIDVDVTSFYPSIAIVNRIYPEHLGVAFCDVYADVKRKRMQYKKGTPENALLKLALNATFGKTNSIYSPFHDPQYTMSITINGQLLICLLAERLMEIPGLRMIQANTDGLTVKCPHDQIEQLRSVCKWWELYTGMDLEEARYSRMFIRDVNNYLAEYESGKLKRKGAYAHIIGKELGWYQNHSALVIPKAAEAALVHGDDVARFIVNHPEPMDFLLRTKVPGNSYLLHGDQKVQNITRYYISTNGKPLVKVMPPLAKNPDKERHISINAGWLATECNVWDGKLDWINYDFYIQEAKKLVEPLV